MELSARNELAATDATKKLHDGRVARLLRGPVPVVVLLGSFLALGLSAADRQSPTFDEGLYVAAGYSYWTTSDYRLHSENGNLIMRWEALPLWLAGCGFPSLDSPDWQAARPVQIADSFLYQCGNDADHLVMRGRQMVAVLSAALGLIVYLWSRKLFGPFGGLISLTLYASSPAILSNGFLATSDMAVTLWFTAATWSTWSVFDRVSPWTLAASCLSLAALFLSKFSAAIIIPIGMLLWWRDWAAASRFQSRYGKTGRSAVGAGNWRPLPASPSCKSPSSRWQSGRRSDFATQ